MVKATIGMILSLIAAILALIAPAFPETVKDLGQGQAIVTILPKKGGEPAINILQRNIQAKVNGKETTVTGWTRLRDPSGDLELVILIDGSARTSLGRQLGDIANFVKSLPANVKATVGYMDSGRAALAGPLSANHSETANQLHLPVGMPGSNSSPYFCLSDLAKHWPSENRAALREVVLITDGVDNFYGRYDPNDPYVEAAIADSIKARLVVYSIYWRDRGRRGNSEYEGYDGQSLLLQTTQATGGKSFDEGIGEPLSFSPFFDEIAQRLQNQYLLSFHSVLKGKSEIQSLEFKIGNSDAEVSAPKRVLVEPLSGE